MATKYEWYITGDDTNYSLGGAAAWLAQTFTVGTTGTDENFTVSSIKLLAGRRSTPGTLNVEIVSIDGSGDPDETDVLSSGSIDADTFDTTPSWQEITMSSYELQASTKYGIILKALDGGGFPVVYIRYDGGASAYGGGNMETTADSGANWTASASFDVLFEVWGDAAATGTNFQIQVDEAWKAVAAIKVQVDEAWKDVSAAKVQVDEAWKTIF